MKTLTWNEREDLERAKKDEIIAYWQPKTADPYLWGGTARHIVDILSNHTLKESVALFRMYRKEYRKMSLSGSYQGAADSCAKALREMKKAGA